MDISPVQFVSSPAAHPGVRRLGEKLYELSNHLGNVLSVINDVKLPVDSSGTVISYTSVVVSAQDYSPFGVVLKGRSWSTAEYRYGFNGKEKDDEFSVEDGSYDFGARICDSRLGRWFRVDEYVSMEHSWTPYRMLYCNPLKYIDSQGDFEIPENVKTAYPHFSAFVKKFCDGYAKKDITFKEHLRAFSQSTESEINGWLKEGQGPKLFPTVIPNYGEYTYAEVRWAKVKDKNGDDVIDEKTGLNLHKPALSINFNVSLLVRYEAVMNDPNTTHVERKAYELIMESTLYHELVHYGDGRDGLLSEDRAMRNGKVTNITDEIGKLFERSAYGRLNRIPDTPIEGQSDIIDYVKENFPELVELDMQEAEAEMKEIDAGILKKSYEEVRKAYVRDE
jgi:RHS repeat-associated protein